MKIEVLGPGCPRCIKTEENVKRAVKELNIEAEVIHVSDIKRFMEYKIMMTPAIVVDGEVKVSGTVPTVEEVKGFLQK